jgi:TRAP-type C4-dicarboxylate transport system permease large subunit
MDDVVRLLVIVVFLGILVSLGSALFHLARGSSTNRERTPEDSRKMARALTWRVTLSLVLFLLLMAAWYAGFITPHGIPPGR